MKQNTGVGVKGHIKIFDPNTGEVIVEKNNAINFEAMSMALAYSLGNQSEGFIARMVFGNGGSSIDATGLITYLPPNVTGTNAKLYSQTYYKDVVKVNMTPNHINTNLYSDIVIRCLLDLNEPSLTDGALPFDNDTTLTNSYTFDELGLEVDIASIGMLISHVVFHPVQKSLNRTIQIDYTIRIQALTNLMSI